MHHRHPRPPLSLCSPRLRAQLFPFDLKICRIFSALHSSNRKESIVWHTGDFVCPAEKKPLPSPVPSDPFRLAPPYPNRRCWAGHLDGPACQDGVPRTSIFPRSKVLSAPLPLTPPQSNKTLPGPIHSFSSCSSLLLTLNTTDLPNFFFHDLLESGEEGKTAPRPHLTFFSRLSLSARAFLPSLRLKV